MNASAQKLLLRIAQLARRSDVVVREYQRPAENPIGKWQGVLPSEMFAFYRLINGIRFHFSFDGEETWHGVSLLSLDQDGKKLFRLIDGRMHFRPARAPGTKFAKDFFKEPPADDVTFFLGDDSAWGAVMVGTGEQASFWQWSNDGDLDRLAPSFDAVIDKLTANALAHTWAYDTHPVTDAVLERLAAAVPLRPTFSVAVTKRTESSAHEYRIAQLAGCTDAALSKLIKLLGLPGSPKGATRDDKVGVIATACAGLRDLSEEAVIAIATTLKLQSKTAAAVYRAFQCGADTISRLSLEVTHLAGSGTLSPSRETITRALSAIDGVPFGYDFPGDPVLIQAVRTTIHAAPFTGISWEPYLRMDWDYAWKGDGDKVATFDITTETARVAGLEAGSTYASTALPFTLI